MVAVVDVSITVLVDDDGLGDVLVLAGFSLPSDVVDDVGFNDGLVELLVLTFGPSTGQMLLPLGPCSENKY